jgi:hypothetical protein
MLIVCIWVTHKPSQWYAFMQARFTDPNLTAEGLTKLLDEFPAAVADNTYSSKGWPNSMYGVSKLAVTIYTSILARELQSLPDGKR